MKAIALLLLFITIAFSRDVPECDFNFGEPDVDWPNLQGCPDNMCDKKKYHEQSPVHIKSWIYDGFLKPMDFKGYESVPSVLINKGSHFSVDPPSDYNPRFLNFKLKELHFHAPAENIIGNNGQMPLVMHLIHLSDDGVYNVLGIKFNNATNTASPWLQQIIEQFPLVPKRGNSTNFILPALQPIFDQLIANKKDSYFHFDGSLTTPPCTEAVKWFVLEEPLSISNDQLASFYRAHVLNARPIQRVLEKVSWYTPVKPVAPIQPAPTGLSGVAIFFIIVAIAVGLALIIAAIIVLKKRGTGYQTM